MTAPPPVEPDVSVDALATSPSTTVVQRLRAAGWRMTAQRRVIAEVFDLELADPQADGHVHLTADAVLERARRVLPEVSLATVYNTLRDLVAADALIEVAPDGGARRYDPNIGGHHHLVCVSCGAIHDVTSDTPSLPADQRHGFDVSDVEVTFRGRCPDCRT